MIPLHLNEYLKNIVIINSTEFMGNLICKCNCSCFYFYKTKNELSKDDIIRNKFIKDFRIKYKTIFDEGHQMASYVKKGKEIFGYYKTFDKFVPLESIDYRASLHSPLIISAKCELCGNEIEIFNESKHGYDALTNPIEYSDFSLQKKRPCFKCKNETNKCIITISHLGKEVLIQNSDGEITIDNWTEAFDWITIDLICCQCGDEIKKWIDLETS